MKKMVRCKACGFIMEESKLGDVCPACGVPRISFEPYTDPISENRRRILNFDLHPIAVHFPVSFTVAVLVFSLASFLFSGQVEDLLTYTTKMLVLFLPPVVLLAFLVGLLDGKARFRKIRNSHILKTKIVLGIVLFVLSLGLAVVIWLKAFTDPVFTLISIILSVGALACVFVLSLLGTSVSNAALPGK
ncbi:MAG: rubredoxin-like domain-containing protein [Dehalococcoidia bacterium]